MSRKMRNLLALVLALLLVSPDLAALAEEIAAIRLPSSLKIIEEEAFYGDTSIEEIIVPEGVTQIDDYAFANSSIRWISLPGTLEKIGNYAFYGCENLDNIVIFGDKNVSIGEMAFANCTALSFVSIETEHIPYGAFMNCINLSNIWISSDSLYSISEKAFYNCNNLTTFEIPESVQYIAEDAFTNKITKFPCRIGTYGANWATKHGFRIDITDYYDYLNYGYAISDNYIYTCHVIPANGDTGKASISGWKETDYLSDAFIPESVLIQVLGKVQPFNITQIDERAFARKKNLRSIYIPHTVTSIEPRAFLQCLDLKSVYIPDSVTTIYKDSFEGLRNQIIIYGDSGSYAEKWCLQNGYTFSNNVTFDNIYTISNRIALTGTVVDANGNGINGINVRVNDLSESDGSGSVTAKTNANGIWAVKNLIGSHRYKVTYSSGIYEITPDSFDVFTSQDESLETALATLPMSADCSASITATVRNDRITVGEEAIFDLTLSDADKARLIVDGIVYEEYDVIEGTASVKRRIAKAGEREVQFQAGSNGNWGMMSDIILLHVSSSGTLDEPIFTLNDWYNQGEDVSMSWKHVENATSYVIYVYWNGNIIYKTETEAETFSIPAEKFPYQGEYSIEVIATSLGYSQNGYACACTILGSSLTVDVGGNMAKVGKQKQIKIASTDAYEIQYTITAPDGTILVDSWDVLKNGVLTVNLTPSVIGDYTVKASAYAYGLDIAYKTAEATFTSSNWIEADAMEWRITNLPESHDFHISASDAWNISSAPEWVTASIDGDNLTLTVSDTACKGKSDQLSIVCEDATAYIQIYASESDDVPTILSPANEATVDASDVVISWRAVENAQEYYILVRDTTLPGTLRYETVVTDTLQISISEALLIAGHNYQVKVMASIQTSDEDGCSRSRESSFSVTSNELTTSKGRIVDQNNQPIDSCIIAVMQGDTEIAEVAPDSDGWWSVSGLNGKVDYTFDFYSRGSYEVCKSVTAKGGSTLPDCVIDLPEREFTEMVMLDYKAGLQQLEIDFNTVTSVEDNAEWLSAAVVRGTDDCIMIEITVTENTESEDRSAVITVLAEDIAYRYKVTQAAASTSVNTKYLSGTEVTEASIFEKKGLWIWAKNKYTGADVQAITYISDGDTVIDVDMKLASDTIKRDYYNVYTCGTDITIRGNLEIKSKITFAPGSRIRVEGDVKVGRNGVLDMKDGGKLEVYGNLEFNSSTDHSSYVPKAAIVLYQGFKSLKKSGLLSAASVTLSNYDKYFFHADELLYTSDELSKTEMRRIQLAMVKLLNGRWFETEVLAIRFKMYFGGRIPAQQFSYFDENGNLQRFKLGIEMAMVTQHGKGEVGTFQISYASGTDRLKNYWIYQSPDVTQNQMSACYRSIAQQGIDSIKEIKKCMSEDIVQDAAVFIVAQMADVIGNKSIPEAFASFEKNYKQTLMDIIEG